MSFTKKSFFLLFFIHVAVGGTHTVTNTNDNGPGSLRQAILEANNDLTTPRTINFSIDTGVQTIQLLSALPTLTIPEIIIDGSTQPGWSAGNPQIVLDCSIAKFKFNGLTIESNNCVIQDLVINNGFLRAIHITDNAHDNAVYNCFIGTNQAGDTAVPNWFGIVITSTSNAQNNIIGAPNKGNLISGNNFGGILLAGNIQGTLIQSNRIGTDKDGLTAIPNGLAGVTIMSLPIRADLTCSNTKIGGTGLNEGNLIAGQETVPGIMLGNQNIIGTLIQGNKLGVDISGVNPLANLKNIVQTHSANVLISGTVVGGSNPGEENIE